MDFLFLSISPNDPLWIGIAFAFGFGVKLLGLPPLIGFLFAGFTLNALGAESDEFLTTIADLGITLLLFTIGLKLRLGALAKREVWGVATVHMVATTLLFAVFVVIFMQIGLPLFADLSLTTALLIGFVLSFSSTVFAIKILDELGATGSKHGQVAIGILVIQDIAAVIFLAVSIGKFPSYWAALLLLLFPLRFVLFKILDKSGHGELLVLLGIVLALVGADVFEAVGIKGDVGALVLGMLLAGHSKASELAKALLSFKELFLVGFFLSVGMTALPGWTELMVALVFIVLLPLKVALYYGLFTSFSLRASSSWRSSLNLANYSEFGLIVGALAVSSGWLPKEWLAVFAIALAVSFLISAPLVTVRDQIYRNIRSTLKRLERKNRLVDERDMELTETRIVVFGMGRMGSAAYLAMDSDLHGQVVGVEVSEQKTAMHQLKGRNVVNGDATNPDFWDRAIGLLDNLEIVLLTLPTLSANEIAAQQLREMGYSGFIAATSRFEDEERELRQYGVDFTFNIYAEAGLGFANDLKWATDRMKRKLPAQD